jgi:hypothetical protein
MIQQILDPAKCLSTVFIIYVYVFYIRTIIPKLKECVQKCYRIFLDPAKCLSTVFIIYIYVFIFQLLFRSIKNVYKNAKEFSLKTQSFVE